MKSKRGKERIRSESASEPSTSSRASHPPSGKNAVVACLASSLLLLGWLHLFFLQPLKQEAIDMHQRQLDPTQIVVIPYDASRLFLFVSCSVFARVLLQTHSTVFHQLLRLGADAAVAMAAMVLCGASPITDLLHTGCAAVYLVLLATTPPPHLSLSQPLSYSYLGSMSLIQRLAQPVLPLQPHPELQGRRNDCSYDGLVSLCVVGLNIPFAVLRLYDRGWQWQRWPVPVVVASTYGWVLASVVGLLVPCFRPDNVATSSLQQEKQVQ